MARSGRGGGGFDKQKGTSRFPSGMTTKKAKDFFVWEGKMRGGACGAWSPWKPCLAAESLAFGRADCAVVGKSKPRMGSINAILSSPPRKMCATLSLGN